MKKTILPATMAIAVMLPVSSFAQEADDNIPSGFDKKIATIQLMSYMNYVVYTLSEYKNPFVIEDEYRHLDDNLYLNRIDNEGLSSILGMLETINSMRVEDARREHFYEGQARIAQQTRADLFMNIAKASLSSGMQATALVAEGVKGNVKGIAELSKTIADESIGVYERWRDVQKRLEQESSDYKFNYEIEKDKELHKQNMQQLMVQHKLTEDYGLDDQYRLSKENAKALVEVVKSIDKKGAFRRMRHMKENQPAYDKFPMFWCYYAAFALDSGETKEALAACNHFKDINKHSVFKHDRMTALIAMTEISSLLKEGSIDKDKVRKALRTVQAYNYNSEDVDMAYFCASTYYSVLGDADEARKALNVAIDVLEDAARNSLTKYCDLNDPGQPEKPWGSNPPPVMTDLFRCRALLQAISDSGKDEDFHEYLGTVLESSIASSMEKLFFVGDVRVKDLWKKARLDVESIQLRYEKHDLSRNSLVVLVPISWFTLGDFPIQIDLMKGGTRVKTLEETKKTRMLAFDDLTYAKIQLQCPAKDIKGVDDYVLRMPHKSWPVAIHFRPPSSVDVKNAKFQDDISLFIPQRVEFMGHTFPLYEEGDNVNAELFHVQLKEVEIPRKLLQKSLKDMERKAMLKDSQLYVEVSRRMGEVVWRSQPVDVGVKTEEGIERFEFPTDKSNTSFAFMWKPSDRINVSVKVAEKSLIDATYTTAGGLSGAAAGAGIGAATAAAFTGGLGAPAGALIGGVIGFFSGAGIGAIIPIKGARTVVSFGIPSDEFGLNGKLEKNYRFLADDVETASITFEGGQRKDPVPQNELQLQKNYVVRLRGISISGKVPKFKDGAEYYMLVSLSGEEKPIRIDLPRLHADTFVPMETTLGLMNRAGESSIEIWRKSIGKDVQVFKAFQGETNGKSWVFIGKTTDKYGSYVEFDTFPAGG